MADYIYLLQHRLSSRQQNALGSIRDVARQQGLTVFLVGGAVRDLTSGSPVRDLDVVVQGNALKLKKEVELAGATIMGEMVPMQALFARFPGGVRVEIGSALSVSYPKPGKPVVQAATILDDLRRRDFTANAMALSLNDGSYGLLMDPLNGVADIENRELRLVSNYGFIEDPVRMIRAARFAARLGWTMDEKTRTRYETGKAEKYISALSGTHRGYEAEEIFHEEDPLRVLRKLEEEGWMKHLFPAITLAKANTAELEKLRDVQTQLQMSGLHPDAAAAHFPLMTAKLAAGEIAELKKSFVRPGFVAEIEALEADAKEFATQLAGKGAALPSQAWSMIHAAKPEAVLWAAYSSKSPAVQAKLKSFQTEWPKARQKVPFALMQEMRIVPELESFDSVVEKVFFELMDGKLTTPEEQKAFLEPYSPPAPPPPVNLRRSRAGKKDGKGAKGKKKLEAIVDLDEDDEIEHDRQADDDENEDVALPDDVKDDDEPLSLPPEITDDLPEEIDEPEETLEAEPFVAPAVPPMMVVEMPPVQSEAATPVSRTKAERPAKQAGKAMPEVAAKVAPAPTQQAPQDKISGGGKTFAVEAKTAPKHVEASKPTKAKTLPPPKTAVKKAEAAPPVAAKAPVAAAKMPAKTAAKTPVTVAAAPAPAKGSKPAVKQESTKAPAAPAPKQAPLKVPAKTVGKKGH